MTIAEVAHETGLSAYTLRFYEREGLLISQVARSTSGRRHYEPADVRWLRHCVRLRQTGMPIERLRAYVALIRAGQGNEVERLAILEHHREALHVRITELSENLAGIEGKIGEYRERLASGVQCDSEGCKSDTKRTSADNGGQRATCRSA